MRLPTNKHRLEWHASALVCVAFVWLGACGCQGPQFDRLDGSPTAYGGTHEPVVDNVQPSVPAAAHDTPASPDAVAQSRSNNDAAVIEKLNCGHREAALNHYEQAEVCYRGVLDLEPDNAVANHRLAILADRRGDYVTAEKCYRRALKREPNNPDLLSDLGYSYFLQGRNAESERCLLAATRGNPLHQKALANLSLLYAKLGDRDRAYEMLKRAVGETEARARLAQLFPPGRPAVPDDDSFTASFAPFSAHDIANPNGGATVPTLTTANGTVPAENRSTAGPGWQSGTPDAPRSNFSSPQGAETTGAVGQPALEKQLADLMERERQRALEARAQRESGGTQFAPPGQPVTPGEPLAASPSPVPLPQQAARVPAEPAATGTASFGAASAPPGGATGRVPDDRINDAFAAIDRETDHSAAAAPTASKPESSPSAPVSPWGNSGGIPTTELAPGPPASPLASMPRWPPQTAPSPAPSSPTLPSPSADGASSSATRLSSSDTANSRTASLPSNPHDWEPVQTAPPSGMNAGPETISPTAKSSATSQADNPQATPPAWNPTGDNRDRAAWTVSPNGPPATRPEGADSKEDWDRQTNPSPPQWSAGTAVNAEDGALSAAGSPPNVPLDSQPNSSPRIVLTGILPVSGALQPPGKRVTDELDEFEAQLQKNNANRNPGRSSSNAGTVAKPAVQPLPREQQAAASKSALPGDSSEVARDPWSVRIEPHRDPTPLFAPDDFSVTNKKPANEKPASFDTGTNWSDLPAWQGVPAPGSSPADRDSGPAIHPGSY